MKLTIITINYNNLSGLKDTVKSILSQTFKNFEYVVIDGGSNDGSAEFIKENSGSINFWVSERDSGIYSAMNKGLANSHGEYVIFMNSGDCLYSESTLDEISSSFETGEDFIVGNCLDVNVPDTDTDELFVHPEKLTFRYLFERAFRFQAVFVKRSLHQRAGIFDESLKIASDWKFSICSFAFHGATYKHIDFTICRYDRTGVSSKQIELGLKEREDILDAYFSFFKADYQEYILFTRFMQQHEDFAKRERELSVSFNPRTILKSLLPYGLVRLIQKLKLRKKPI